MTPFLILAALAFACLSVGCHLGTRLTRDRSLPYLSGAFAALAMVAVGGAVWWVV